MKLIFMGTPDFAAPSLKALLAAGHEICAVVTKPDTPKGRSGKVTFSPVKEIAVAENIPVLQPEGKLDAAFCDQVAGFRPDAVVVIAFGKIIPKALLDSVPLGCINVHASLLPAYRGAAPIQWAVLNGEKEAGVSVMKMGEGLDTGDIYAAEAVQLDEQETSDSLFDKLSVLGARLLVETLPAIAKGEITPVPQPRMSTTEYARMIVKSDGLIDWNRPAGELDCFVRGMNSWPGAFTKMQGKTVKIWKAAVTEEETGLPAGSVMLPDKETLLVQTGTGCLKVEELQLEGKKRMSAADFLRGSQWKTGLRFTDA